MARTRWNTRALLLAAQLVKASGADIVAVAATAALAVALSVSRIDRARRVGQTPVAGDARRLGVSRRRPGARSRGALRVQLAVPFDLLRGLPERLDVERRPVARVLDGPL